MFPKNSFKKLKKIYGVRLTFVNYRIIKSDPDRDLNDADPQPEHCTVYKASAFPPPPFFPHYIKGCNY